MRISDWSSDVCSSDLPIGERITIVSGHDSADVGTALHSVLAASFGSAGPLSCDEISALLKRYRVEGCADCEEIRTFVVALCGWINNRWPSTVVRSEEHTSELQSLMRISYAVFCLKKKKNSP